MSGGIRYATAVGKSKLTASSARQLGVTILAYSPLAQGLLTGKYPPDSSETPSDARRIDSRFSKDGLKKIEPVISLLRQLGEKRTHPCSSSSQLVDRSGALFQLQRENSRTSGNAVLWVGD